MANLSLATFVSLFLLPLGFSFAAIDDHKVYIVRLEGHALPMAKKLNKEIRQSAASQKAFAKSAVARQLRTLESADVPLDSVHHHYANAINGFAAKLSTQQAETLKASKGVLSVTLERQFLRAATEKSIAMNINDPASFDLPQLYSKTNGSGMIIGVLGGGIWPEHPSFSAVGIAKKPKKFKGICQAGYEWPSTTCNNKVIGNRYYTGLDSSRDFEFEDYSTFDKSVAAGNKINLTFDGISGQVQGVAYGAHIAVYKVCGSESCLESNVLAAMEHAVTDGVDVLFSEIPRSLTCCPLNDAVEIGLFHLALAGVAASVPSWSQVVGFSAPWYMASGSSYSTREFEIKVHLGDGTSYTGIGLTNGTVPRGERTPTIPIVYAGNVAADDATVDQAKLCSAGSLNTTLINGKIVLCDRGIFPQGTASDVASMGAAGVLIRSVNPLSLILELTFQFPGALIGYSDGLKILNYTTSTENPTASIAGTNLAFGDPKLDEYYDYDTPPNPLRVMKPDLIAPGTFFGGAAPPADFVGFSSPTIPPAYMAGAIALLKAAKPKWSISAVNSALTTTAMPFSTKSFDYGAGLVRPDLALNPGLVYLATSADMTHFFCYFSNTTAGLNCSSPRSPDKYNTPSLVISTPLRRGFSRFRKVQNVGPPGSYSVSIEKPEGTDVTITPSTLTFARTGQILGFKIRINGTAKTNNPDQDNFAFGSWTWKSADLSINVRSPLFVRVY